VRESIVGTLKRYEDFKSRFVPARNVDIWLPPEYDAGSRLPVIYMQDGQNLFDSEIAYGGVDWGIDEAIARLVQERGIGPAIVVGIWSTEHRWREYMPEKALETSKNRELKSGFVREQGGTPVSDRYLQFVVEEVKRRVDEGYGTRAERENTFIMGSSMGGLVSLYAVCEYPDVFGGAGCLSTHWPAGDGAVVEYVREAVPAAGRHRIYFDCGTETLDAAYEPYQKRVDEIMREKGYEEGRDWVTYRFEGAEHSERAWRKRVGIPLAFLLRRKPA
jgi:predicted alpha/beta superfamily hydrolase